MGQGLVVQFLVTNMASPGNAKKLKELEADERLDHASREDGRPAPATTLSRWRDGRSANKVQMEGFGEY